MEYPKYTKYPKYPKYPKYTKYTLYFTNRELRVPQANSALAPWSINMLNSLGVRVRGEHVVFEESRDRRNASAVLSVVSSDKLRSMGFSGLSAAEVSGPRPRKIYINEDNYYHPPMHWIDKDAYRKYVIAHEVLHSIGGHHVKSVSIRGKPCPLLLPQTDVAVVQKAGCQLSWVLSTFDQEILDHVTM